MCFSVQADLAVGLGLIPLAVATLAEVRTRRELPFALLPGLFAAHQLVEALVWLGVDGRADGRVQAAAALAYLVFALPVLPVLLPVAVLLLEPHGARLRVARPSLSSVSSSPATWATSCWLTRCRWCGMRTP